MSSTRLKILVVSICFLAQLFAPLPAVAGSESNKSADPVGPNDPALASILTVLNVPVRGVACGLSGLLGSVVMFASGGARYPLAAEIMEEGCSGPWIITPQMIHSERLPKTEMTGIDDALLVGRQGASATPAGDTVTTTAGDPDSLSSLDALREGKVPATSSSSPLGEIYFDFDRHELRPDAQETLDSHAGWLQANPSIRVEIEGHCDERGSNEYNMALGAKRAHSTKDYLVKRGITADRLSTISYGEELPVCRDPAEECWQRNRRARFVIVLSRPGS